MVLFQNAIVVDNCMFLSLPSQTTPPASFGDDERAKLTDRIQNAGTEVVEAKAGGGYVHSDMCALLCRVVLVCIYIYIYIYILYSS